MDIYKINKRKKDSRNMEYLLYEQRKKFQNETKLQDRKS